jgi:hypothetical protein
MVMVVAVLTTILMALSSTLLIFNSCFYYLFSVNVIYDKYAEKTYSRN